VQLEHEALLRCLVKQHGLSRVLSEGLTPEYVGGFRDVIAGWRKVDRDLADLRKRLAALKSKSKALDKDLADMEKDLRLRMLESSAVDRLELVNLDEALPLDDDDLLGWPSGASQWHGEARQGEAGCTPRRQGQGGAGNGSVSVLLLGASHDLAASVRRLWATGRPNAFGSRRRQFACWQCDVNRWRDSFWANGVA
jgi:hypothetical protein